MAPSPLQVRLASAVVGVVLLAGVAAACGEDDETATTTSIDVTTTTEVTPEDEGLAATLDDLCAQLADLRGVVDQVEAPDAIDEAVASLVESLRGVERRLEDLGGADRTDQVELVAETTRGGLDLLEAAGEAAVAGNFGEASDLFQQAMDELDAAINAVMDLGFEDCAAERPEATTTTTAGTADG